MSECYKCGPKSLGKVVFPVRGEGKYICSDCLKVWTPERITVSVTKNDCETCSGEGQIYAEHYGETSGGICPNCNGSGKRTEKPMYIVHWKLRDSSGKEWYEEHNKMSLDDFEVLYGANVNEIIWCNFRQENRAMI